MKVGLPSNQFRLRRQSLSIKTVLTRIVGMLMAFYLLTLSACLGDLPSTKTMPRTTPTTTHLGDVPSTKIALTPAETTNQDSRWNLVWSDEFDGPQGAPPDPSKWTPDVGGQAWGNRELEYSTNNQNAYKDGQGNLVLEARKGNPAGYQCWYGSCQYTSARLSTRGHFNFTYGLVEARIKIPYDQGIWPAFWLPGSNCETVGWPTCGEIDVMENNSLGGPATIYGVVHGPEKFSSGYTLQDGSFADDFHIFALQWDINRLYFFVDGDNYATLDRGTLYKQEDWVYDHPFNVALNLSVGGDWPGSPSSTTVFPQKMYVSYVRLYTDK